MLTGRAIEKLRGSMLANCINARAELPLKVAVVIPATIEADIARANATAVVSFNEVRGGLPAGFFRIEGLMKAGADLQPRPGLQRHRPRFLSGLVASAINLGGICMDSSGTAWNIHLESCTASTSLRARLSLQ